MNYVVRETKNSKFVSGLHVLGPESPQLWPIKAWAKDAYAKNSDSNQGLFLVYDSLKDGTSELT